MFGEPPHRGTDAELEPLDRVGFVTDRLRLRPTKVVAGVFEDLDQQLFLGREVPIEDALAHADPIDELVDRSWVVAVLGEAVGGVVEQLSTLLVTPLRELLGHDQI